MIEALPPSRNPNPPQNVLVDQNHSRFGKHQQRQPHTLDQQEHEHQQLRKEKNLSNYLDIGGEDDYEQQFEFLPKTCKAIEVNSTLESGCLRYDTTHKLWGMLNLKVNKNLSRNIAAVDFVVVVDISASMILDKKLAFVKLSIHYLLDLLNENHRLALVFFNHDVSFASKLAYCTNEKKKEFIDILEKIQASGSTNISKALFTGNKILLDRDESTRDRISTLMLITDGLSNIGLTSEETLTSLNSLSLPSGCVFHTFGIGEDHDSCLLNSISSKTKGVYYYISSSDHIHKIFGGCIQSLLTSRVRFIDILLQAQDGCRMISIATPFQTKEIEKAKEYSVNIGLMYSGEYKTILFRLSLRKMNKILLKHPLLKVCVQYLDVATGKVECIKTDLNIERREFSLDPTIPLLLDQNLNRYYAVTTILEAIEDCNRLQFSNAQKKLSDRIEAILLSSSGNLSYCNHLVNDLRECILGMQDVNSFQTGSHIAHSYASMYYMERSSGVEIKKSMSNIDGYGYLTEDQLTLQESYSLDQEKSNKLLSKYLHT